MALSHSPQIVRDGLVLHLDAANPKSYPGSGNIWFDLSGSENNATLTNGPVFISDNKGSFTFDGVDDYVVLPYSTTMNVDYVTLSVWIRSTYLIGPRVRHYVFDGLSHKTMIYIDEPYEVNFVNLANSTVSNSINYPSISDNNWHNIVGAYDDSYSNMYIDGILVKTVSSNGPIQNATGGGRLMDYIGNGYETEGNASNFMMYDRALTESEIQQNFEAYRDRYGV